MIATNHPIWRFCSNEVEAFRNRTFIYNSGHVFRSPGDGSIEGNQCECRYCQIGRNRIEPHRSSNTSICSTSDPTTIHTDDNNNNPTTDEGGSSSPRRGELHTTVRDEPGWEFLDVSITTIGGNDNTERDPSSRRTDQQLEYGTRPTVGSSGSTTGDNDISDPSNGSSDTLVEQTGGESRSPKSVHLPIGRGHAIGHHQQHRLQQDHSGSPPNKSRRISGRVLN